jgi:hypothetical protein
MDRDARQLADVPNGGRVLIVIEDLNVILPTGKATPEALRALRR